MFVTVRACIEQASTRATRQVESDVTAGDDAFFLRQTSMHNHFTTSLGFSGLPVQTGQALESGHFGSSQTSHLEQT